MNGLRFVLWFAARAHAARRPHQMTLQYLFSLAIKRHHLAVARECVARLRAMAALATHDKIVFEADVVARHAQLLIAEGLLDLISALLPILNSKPSTFPSPLRDLPHPWI